MADELISRQALMKKIEEEYDLNYGEILMNPREFADMVAYSPAVDAVEVVRCKDCRYSPSCETEILLREYDGIENPYCAAGKRREENAYNSDKSL